MWFKKFSIKRLFLNESHIIVLAKNINFYKRKMKINFVTHDQRYGISYVFNTRIRIKSGEKKIGGSFILVELKNISHLWII